MPRLRHDSSLFFLRRRFAADEAAGQMVVDHPDCLHKGVNDGRTDKFEAHLLQITADPVGERRGGGHLLQSVPMADDRRVVHVSPDHPVETAVLPNGFQKRLSRW